MSDPLFDDLEQRDPEQRERALLSTLPDLLRLVAGQSPGYARLYDGIDTTAVTSRADLARLPVLRKSALPSLQADDPPLGGLATKPPGRMARLFASPGPIFEAEGDDPDHWHSARALFATGFRPGDVIQNCFAYHFTPAGVMFETGARRIGCAVVPAGVGNTELQARVMATLRPRGYVGTPDFLKVILEKADELGLDCRTTRLAHVSGGPYLPPLRAFYEARGIAVFQSYGIADLGVIAYETPAREGLVVEEAVLVEIVRPGTGDPVADGEVGEVLVTTFSPDYPLIRFATGDLSAALPGTSPCGRTNMRIKGWMGRADQTTKVRGMFVHPGQIAEVARRHPDIGRVRLVVTSRDGLDDMLLRVELRADDPPAGTALAGALEETLQSVTKLRGRVDLVPAGSLPNDGKVIEDARDYG